ncbi:MAG: hypothetical protein AAGG07_11140 [Planctomycetota bacterium]
MHRRISTAITVSLLGLAGPAHAAISISMPERSVSALANFNGPIPTTDLLSTQSAGVFSDTAEAVSGGNALEATASQDTRIERLQAWGEGSSSIDASGFPDEAASSSSVEFIIDADESFDLILSYDLGAVASGSALATSSLRFERTDNNALLFGATSLGTNTQLIAATLTFNVDPGQYRISVTTDTLAGNSVNRTDGGGTADADFFFRETIIPSPASAALLGLGGLAATRRRG